MGATRVDEINADFTIPAAAITLNDTPFYESGWAMSAGADLGVAWALSETVSLAVEAGARYHADLKDDDSGVGGLGLAGINDTGSRTSYPISLRLTVRF